MTVTLGPWFKANDRSKYRRGAVAVCKVEQKGAPTRYYVVSERLRWVYSYSEDEAVDALSARRIAGKVMLLDEHEIARVERLVDAQGRN